MERLGRGLEGGGCWREGWGVGEEGDWGRREGVGKVGVEEREMG